MIAADRLLDARSPGDEWRRLETAERRLLLLDFDGTLAPFEIDRARVRAVPGVLETIREIVTRRIAVVGLVSGRPLDQIVELTGGLPGPLVGEHGWEERTAAGERILHAPSSVASALLARAADLVENLVEPSRLERKRTALVVHTRGLALPTAELLLAEVGRRWSDLLRRAEVRLHRIDGGCELRAVGRSKGTAVESIRRSVGGSPLTVYVGDDETDEDAFRTVAGAGVGILVGSTGRTTSAHAMLPNVFAVAEYLSLWLERLAPAPSPVAT